ncbi:RNA-directed DNA polymerase, eukaryota [Tanacetum coccineum]
MALVNPSLVRSLWGSANIDFLVGDAVGLSGGTLLMWDSYIFARDEVLIGTHYVCVIGKWNGVTEKLAAIWILFGDFNVVRTCEERLGSNFMERDAKSFNNFIVNKALEDLAIGGRRFTRFNSTVSDHCPILMSVDEVNFGPKCFKIFNHWMDIEGFDNFIESSWNNEWDTKAEEGCLTSTDRLKREEYLMDLNFLEKNERDSLKQKSKVKWAVKGDENTKFFHSRVNKNSKRQNINGLVYNGSWVEAPETIFLATFNHFASRFHEEKPNRPKF